MKGDQAIMQSSTHAITSTKEYKEKIKTESKSEINLTQSSSSLTEVVQLDPNVSIIPGKSKPDPNMQAYFTEDELSKKKEIAGKKLNLRGGPKRVDNIVTKINDNDIEKTEEEKTEEKPKTSFVSKPLPHLLQKDQMVEVEHYLLKRSQHLHHLQLKKVLECNHIFYY